jgi:hypothetical protein
MLQPVNYILWMDFSDVKTDYEFLCSISVWHIAVRIAQVKKTLQAKFISVHQASKMLYGLQNILQETRGGNIER